MESFVLHNAKGVMKKWSAGNICYAIVALQLSTQAYTFHSHDFST